MVELKLLSDSRGIPTTIKLEKLYINQVISKCRVYKRSAIHLNYVPKKGVWRFAYTPYIVFFSELKLFIIDSFLFIINTENLSLLDYESLFKLYPY